MDPPITAQVGSGTLVVNGACQSLSFPPYCLSSLRAGAFLLPLLDVLCLPDLPGSASSFKYRFDIKTRSKFLSFTFCPQPVSATQISTQPADSIWESTLALRLFPNFGAPIKPGSPQLAVDSQKGPGRCLFPSKECCYHVNQPGKWERRLKTYRS